MAAGKRHRVSRRNFLGRGISAGGAALLAGPGCGWLAGDGDGELGSNRLVPDPGGLIDLPPGFQYRVVSERGQRLSRGGRVPGEFDGMGAFQARGGETLLIRNHELGDSGGESLRQRRPYDRGEPGGTTAVLLDRDRRLVRQFATSSGTTYNCAGGATPWGTWITCEEDRTDGHGYAFEVDPRAAEGRLSRTPIEAMGHFAHEAVGIDPDTGIVYLTEDPARADADAAAFLYRFRPRDRKRRPGALQKGGRLEALALEQRPAQNASLFESGQEFGVVWRRVDPRDPHEDARRGGCVRFGRLEGCDFAGGAFWFADTEGGEAGRGQLFRYLPATKTLELFLEGADGNPLLDHPDNLTVTPFGDLWFCTDGDNRVVGITPEGELYEFARNTINDSEFAGPCFSPDGRTFFVNMQEPGLTFAIWGPFGGERARRANASGGSLRDLGRQRRLAVAEPPASIAPRTSEALCESAARSRLTVLEALAYERLGVALT